LQRNLIEERGECEGLMYTLIANVKLNDVDPQAWLADVLARIADTPHTSLSDLLPWKWSCDHASPPHNRGPAGGLRIKLKPRQISIGSLHRPFPCFGAPQRLFQSKDATFDFLRY
jgi:hypothetical protein